MAGSGRMDSLLCFSYGSNMSTARLKERIPSACLVAVARLHGHRVKFHKRGKDNSGKCDASYSGKASDVVYGTVSRIPSSDKSALDRMEGLGSGYLEKIVPAIMENGETVEAFMYYATDIDSSLKPYEWYKEHVVRGAREHGLPPDYIAAIEVTEAIPDPCHRRRHRELSIYR